MLDKKVNFDKRILNGVSTLELICKNFRLTAISLLMLVLCNFAFAGTGHSILDLVDPAFNAQIQTDSFSHKTVDFIKPLSNGKILVGGHFNSYNRQPVSGLVRLNADATLDTTFNNNSLQTGNYPVKIALQADGKIVIITTKAPEVKLIRLNSDGTIDATFDYYNGSNLIYDVTVDASGRILLSGVFSDGRKVIRLNINGSVDTTFWFVSNQSVEHIAAQNNKMIVSLPSGSQRMIQRLNDDSSIDASFTPKILTNSIANKIIVQSDGKILVLSSQNLQRLNENGGDDSSFTTTNFPGAGRMMHLSNDGTITASFNTGNSVQIKKFLSNGGDDTSFTPYTLLPINYGTFGVQSDGSVLIGDLFISGGGAAIPNNFSRLLPNGSLDNSFNVGGIGFQNTNPGSVRAITVQPDGKIVIGGIFDSVNNSPRFKIARLNVDSTLDPTFQVNTSGTGNAFSQIYKIYNIAVQTNGKLIVSGFFNYSVNGSAKRDLVRLNSDGSIDSTFNLAVPVPEYFSCCAMGTNKIASLNEDKIIVGTSRNSSLNSTTPVPLKINTDGTRDSSFNSTVYAAPTRLIIWDLVVQPDGKIIIGGTHSTLGSVSKSFVTRLNIDGSVDQTFQPREENDKQTLALALQANGKILIVESHQNQSTILRLNADGTVDNSFNSGTGANGKINALLVSSTGKIFVGGKFSQINGQPRQNLGVLNENGNLDAINYNVNQEVLSLAIDGEGRVLLGGDFTVINVGQGQNHTRSYLARLIDSTQSNKRTRFDFDGDGRADLAAFAPTSGEWSILQSQTNHLLTTRFGTNGDKSAATDFDGDGKTDIAVYRPAEGIWYLLRSNEGFSAVRFGAAEDKPVAADFDGDGKADIAVWRPSNGFWYVLQSSTNKMRSIQFGHSNDLPLNGADFDGDGKVDVAVWRPSNGFFYWLSSAADNAFKALQFGSNGDVPVVGDFNGDGKTDFVVFRPSEGIWYQNISTAAGNLTFAALPFGQNGDEPVAADYNGDGKTDIAVRRGNIWHLLLSSQGYSGVTLGNASAQAVAALKN